MTMGSMVWATAEAMRAREARPDNRAERGISGDFDGR
jgi:hypothetical protein